MEELSRYDVANIKRLEACIVPNVNKIASIKKKTLEYVAKQEKQIAELEGSIAGFQELIDQIKGKPQPEIDPVSLDTNLDDIPVTSEEGDSNEEQSDEDYNSQQEEEANLGVNDLNIDNMFL